MLQLIHKNNTYTIQEHKDSWCTVCINQVTHALVIDIESAFQATYNHISKTDIIGALSREDFTEIE